MSMVVEPDREPLGEQSVLKPSRGYPGGCFWVYHPAVGVVSTQLIR